MSEITDPWVASLEIDHEDWRWERGLIIEDGLRTIHVGTIGSQKCVKKWDVEQCASAYGSTCCGAREKVAGDLAHLIGANVPATALWSHLGDTGCFQHFVPHSSSNLQAVFNFFESESDLEETLAIVRRAYDPILLGLDLWLGNRDRFENLKNTMFSESSTCVTVWGIDFNCCLGDYRRGWECDLDAPYGTSNGNPPIPKFVVDDHEWLANAKKSADNVERRIARIPDDQVIEIVRRSFEFYPEACRKDEPMSIAQCLIKRRTKISEWIRSIPFKAGS